MIQERKLHDIISAAVHAFVVQLSGDCTGGGAGGNHSVKVKDMLCPDGVIDVIGVFFVIYLTILRHINNFIENSGGLAN